MKAFATSTMIQSTPETVWAVLTDGAQWAQWNPTVDKVVGKIAPGEKISVRVKLSRAARFRSR